MFGNRQSPGHTGAITMSDPKAQIAVKELLTLFDHVLEEHGFGWDHWHSILWNLHNVVDEEWEMTPAGDGRTIRELIVHLGVSFLMYDNHAFGDGTRVWGDWTIDGTAPGSSPTELKTWIQDAHRCLRGSIARLADDELGTLRKAPWGEAYETRRLIELQIQHTLYHVGEINHIRSLLQGNDDWDHQDMGRET